MTYEVLLSKGRQTEKGRFSGDKHVFIINYVKDRQPEYEDYESMFKGTSHELAAYIKTNADNWADLNSEATQLVPRKVRLVDKFFAFFGL